MALKFLAGDLGKDPKFIKRFRMEARAAYQLRHPNIVEVTNLDQGDDGSLFIAMEFVEGPSLRKVLEQAAGAFDIPRALEITREIASGLATAHAQGTVHRDVKPENVLLIRAADGREKPKILDFGIAAVAESVTRLSMPRGFLLTPDYAAPELWLEMPADEMDGRTDLYALGWVLYEMLTGSMPFHAHNTSAGCTSLGKMCRDGKVFARDYSRALALAATQWAATISARCTKTGAALRRTQPALGSLFRGVRSRASTAL